MLRKKNYKQESQFELHNFAVYAPATHNLPPKKCLIYFRRYRPAQQPADVNLYSLVHGKSEATTKQISGEYPIDRTLELITFDRQLDFLQRVIKKIGKIRRYECGDGLYKGQHIFTAMCVFKFEFDLAKCFKSEYMQEFMRQQSAPLVKDSDRQSEQVELIQNHLPQEMQEKMKNLGKMQEDGFQVVTDIYGQYRLDRQANQKWVSNLPQVKKQQKKENKKLQMQQKALQQT